MHRKNLHPDKEKISVLSKKLRTQHEAYRLQLDGNFIRDFRTNGIPSNIKEYREMEKLYATYNLTKVAHKEGELYTALHSYFFSNVGDANISFQFEDMTIVQLVHLTILLICSNQGKEFLPFFSHGEQCPTKSSSFDCEIIRGWAGIETVFNKIDFDFNTVTQKMKLEVDTEQWATVTEQLQGIRKRIVSVQSDLSSMTNDHLKRRIKTTNQDLLFEKLQAMLNKIDKLTDG